MVVELVCGRDTGGNGFSVRFYGTSTNLHSVWDTRILEVRRRLDRDGADSGRARMVLTGALR